MITPNGNRKRWVLSLQNRSPVPITGSTILAYVALTPDRFAEKEAHVGILLPDLPPCTVGAIGLPKEVNIGRSEHGATMLPVYEWELRLMIFQAGPKSWRIDSSFDTFRNVIRVTREISEADRYAGSAFPIKRLGGNYAPGQYESQKDALDCGEAA